jgi:biopolymer transport protein ExbB
MEYEPFDVDDAHVCRRPHPLAGSAPHVRRHVRHRVLGRTEQREDARPMTLCAQKPNRSQSTWRRLAPAVLAGQVLLAAPLWAQELPPAAAPQSLSASPAETAPAPEDPALEAAAPNAPAIGSVDGGAAEAPAAGPELPAAAGALPEAPVAEAPAPAPSLMEDPAGAIAHMMTPRHRDPALPHDLSPWGMFLAADIVVKAVMLGLAFASIVTWTIFLAKTIEMTGAMRNARAMLRAIRSARSLDDAASTLDGRRGPAAAMVATAQSEMSLSEAVLDHAGGDGLKERVSAAVTRIEARAGRKIAIGTGILATIGSTSPFVGLFGTVWGIMNAFIGISKSQTTNLAVVAPGIAEALLATAIGLVAAIPAVIIYNHFARQTARYKHLLGDAATGVEILVSRDLDYRQVPHGRGAVLAAVRPAAAE